MDGTLGMAWSRLVCGVLPLAVALSSTNAAAATADPIAITTEPPAPASEASHAARGARPTEATSSNEEGLLGPVRLGVVAGVAFPRPVAVEGMLKVRDLVSIGLEYSVLPPVTVSGFRASLYAVDVDVCVFPFRGGFFLGMNAGKQHFDTTGSAVLPAGLGTTPEQITADTWFVGARIGYLRTWKSGFTLGMDAGAQIPVAASFANTVPMQVPISQTATDVSHVIGKNVLPNVNLLRVGYLF